MASAESKRVRSRGQFDGQRQTVEAPADLGDGRGVFGGQREAWTNGASLLDEERDRRREGHLRQSAESTRWAGQWADLIQLLSGQRQWFAAGDQQAQARAGREQVAQERRGAG